MILTLVEHFLATLLTVESPYLNLFFSIFLCYNTNMNDLKHIISNNLVELRKRKKYTQQDLANMLGYSDKSIYKWEKGDSLPDIETLYQICNLYNVTLDYLTHEGTWDDKQDFVIKNYYRRNKILIVLMVLSVVWTIAIAVLAYSISFKAGVPYWTACTWAVPASALVLLYFNRRWGKRNWKYPIIAILIWTGLAAIYLQLLYHEQNIWPIFILGIPVQLVVVLWSQIRNEDI